MHQHSDARFDHSTFGNLKLFRISSLEFHVAPSHRRTIPPSYRSPGIAVSMNFAKSSLSFSSDGLCKYIMWPAR